MLKVQIAISLSRKIQKMLSVKSNTPSLLAPCFPQCPCFLHGPPVGTLGMDQVTVGAMLAWVTPPNPLPTLAFWVFQLLSR